MKTIIKTLRIIRAWILTFVGYGKTVAKERFHICMGCPFLEVRGAFYCGECGCMLATKWGKPAGKVYDYRESCPHPDGAKW